MSEDTGTQPIDEQSTAEAPAEDASATTEAEQADTASADGSDGTEGEVTPA